MVFLLVQIADISIFHLKGVVFFYQQCFAGGDCRVYQKDIKM